MSLCRICAHIAIAFLLRIVFGGSRRQKDTATTKRRRSTAVGGAQSVEKNKIGERPTGYWWYKQVSVPVRQRCSKRMRCRMRCRKVLANQQKDGDSPIQSMVTGLL